MLCFTERCTGLDTNTLYLLAYWLYQKRQRMTDKKNVSKFGGMVVEALPSALFRVKLENGEEVLSYIAGKMRMHKIKVLIGDRVEVEVDQYGGRGRITRRF